jgi:hypothetical protein
MNRPTLSTLALAALASAIILGGTALDHTPLADDSAIASHAELAERLDGIEARLDRAALTLCAEEAGPGALARWTPDGELVCQPIAEDGPVVRAMLGGAAL